MIAAWHARASSRDGGGVLSRRMAQCYGVNVARKRAAHRQHRARASSTCKSVKASAARLASNLTAQICIAASRTRSASFFGVHGSGRESVAWRLFVAAMPYGASATASGGGASAAAVSSARHSRRGGGVVVIRLVTRALTEHLLGASICLELPTTGLGNIARLDRAYLPLPLLFPDPLHCCGGTVYRHHCGGGCLLFAATTPLLPCRLVHTAVVPPPFMFTFACGVLAVATSTWRRRIGRLHAIMPDHSARVRMPPALRYLGAPHLVTSA